MNNLLQAHVLKLDYLLNDGDSDGLNLDNGRGFSVQEVIESVRQE